jgi:iron complex transport system substrate-binding protein
MKSAAAQLLERWDARVATLRNLIRTRFDTANGPQVSVIEVRPDHIRSYVAQSFPGSVMSELGFAWSEQAMQAQSASLRFSGMENIPCWMPISFSFYCALTVRRSPGSIKHSRHIRSGSNCGR